MILNDLFWKNKYFHPLLKWYGIFLKSCNIFDNHIRGYLGTGMVWGEDETWFYVKATCHFYIMLRTNKQFINIFIIFNFSI